MFNPDLARTAPAISLWEVEWIPKRFHQNSDWLEDQDERDHKELNCGDCDHSALSGVHVLHAKTAEYVPFVEVVLFEFLATQPTPLVVASPTN